MENRLRRNTDVFRDLQNKIHRLLRVREDRPDIIRHLLAAIRESCGSDDVGIRFRGDDDFPYVHPNRPFSGFVLKGNATDTSVQEMKVCREDNGKVSLECMCGKVISGKTDPAESHFTPNGSFWANDAPALRDLPENQALGNFSRNECTWRGYGSIAMTPLRAKGRIVGLLQLGYLEKGRFTLETIESLEGVGTVIGEILLRTQTGRRLEFIKGSIDSAPDSAYWMDLEGNFIHVNESGCRALGYDWDELLRMSLFDVVSDSSDGRSDEVRKILRANKKIVTETVFRRGNDTEFPVELTVARVEYDGQACLSAFAQDITQRKMAEQRLRESEARFRATFEQAAVGIAHVAADGRFLRINQKFCDILGLWINPKRISQPFGCEKSVVISFYHSGRKSRVDRQRDTKHFRASFGDVLSCFGLSYRCVYYVNLNSKKSMISLFNSLNFLVFWHNLNPASASFAEETRHQACSCMSIPQALDNEVYSVKEAHPEGFNFLVENPVNT